MISIQKDLALVVTKPTAWEALEAIAAEPDYSMTQRDVFMKVPISPGVIIKDLLNWQSVKILEVMPDPADKRAVRYKINRGKYEKAKQLITLINEILEG